MSGAGNGGDGDGSDRSERPASLPDPLEPAKVEEPARRPAYRPTEPAKDGQPATRRSGIVEQAPFAAQTWQEASGVAAHPY